MVISVWQALLATLFVLCFGSFAWGMRRFFKQPAGAVPGMKVISFCGLIFSIIHLVLILSATSVRPAWRIVAAALYICSLILFWWALASNREKPLSAAFSPDSPSHLVQHGPYRFIRHPFYSSYLLAWTAGVFAAANLWLIPTVLIMLVIYIRAAKFEEAKFAATSLGTEYSSYKASTGLFVPNPFKRFSGRRTDRAWQ